jgi:hypothetical protein
VHEKGVPVGVLDLEAIRAVSVPHVADLPA